MLTGAGTMARGGPSCMISEPSPSTKHWQQCAIKLGKLHVVCEIIPLKDFGKLVGINIPIPNIKIPLMGSTSKSQQQIIVDGKDLVLDFETCLDFENDNYTIEKCDLPVGKLDSMQVYLKGDAVFEKLGELITKPKPVRMALGMVVKIVLKYVMKMFLSDPKMVEAVTMLNCGDTSDIESDERR